MLVLGDKQKGSITGAARSIINSGGTVSFTGPTGEVECTGSADLVNYMREWSWVDPGDAKRMVRSVMDCMARAAKMQAEQDAIRERLPAAMTYVVNVVIDSENPTSPCVITHTARE